MFLTYILGWKSQSSFFFLFYNKAYYIFFTLELQYRFAEDIK